MAKLTELTGVKHLHNLNRPDLKQYLEDRFGVKEVGAGSYGEVFTHPDWNYVIKVFDNDPYYLSFVDYVIHHPNKHYPTIVKKPMSMHSFHTRMPSDADKFFIVKIEKLLPLDKKVANFIVKNFEKVYEATYRQDIMPATAKADQEAIYGKGYIHSDLRPKPWPTIDGGSEVMTYHQFVDAYPWFRTLVIAYHHLREELSGASDIHAGNFMMRKDGTVVMIDPLWEGYSRYKAQDDWYKRETDGFYGNEYDEEPQQVSGPRYTKK